jgi:tryptophan synthase alpha chain
MNKLNTLFSKKKDLLSIYFTAGYPALNSTQPILKTLERAGTDFVEIGMPFSDPLADGPVIQNSSMQSLKNGMTLKILFEQLSGLKESVSIPIILMGYINPVLKMGMENFLKKCAETGVSGVILPDLPLETYLDQYQPLFRKYGISNIFLITPQTPEDRVRRLDEATTSFLYMVSSAAVTGAKASISNQQTDYFDRINRMNLKNPRIVGFGISNFQTFSQVCQYAQGGIVGSAFIKLLEQNGETPEIIVDFIKKLRQA